MMRRLVVVFILAKLCGIYAQSNPTLAYITTNKYDWIYDDRMTGARTDFSIWRPKAVPGYYALGDMAKNGHSTPTTITVMVKDLTGDALAVPTGSTEIWNDRGSGGRHDVRVMRLNAPLGYVCLGDVAVSNYNSVPNYSLYRCVKDTYLTDGTLHLIWTDSGSGASADFSAWQVSTSDGSSLSFNGFKSHRSHSTLNCCAKVLSTSFLKREPNPISDFPMCKLDAVGRGYAGSEFMTTTLKTCKYWSQMSNDQKQGLPSNPAVPLEENYCRNPNSRSEGPWCYVGPGVNNWEACSVPICKSSASCTTTTKGETYVGTNSITKSGRSCQRWDSQSPHTHQFTAASQFPDATVSDAANFCRNPGGQKDGVWCYTTDQTKDWEYCDITVCGASPCNQTNSKRGSIKHVLHVGIDGLHSTCWQQASGGTPNLNSLVNQGCSTTSNARAEIVTSSGPNWGAHLCGMGIQSSGITSNSWSPPWQGNSVTISPVNGKTYPMPCAFNYLKGSDSNVRTGLFHNWDWFDNLGNGGIPGFVDVQYTAYGSLQLGHFRDVKVIDKAKPYLRKVLESAEKSYTFVHMDQVDALGHGTGWCSFLYKSAVDNADNLLGQLLDVVGDKPVLVIVSSDHGGDIGHGNMKDSDLLIPMFVKGPGVRSGYQLTHQVRNRDILPTVAWSLGFNASPFWDGHVMHEIFED